jgi:hypothetical protein
MRLNILIVRENFYLLSVDRAWTSREFNSTEQGIFST